MNRKLILSIFLIGAVSTTIGAFLKIVNFQYSEGFLIFGLILSFFAYIVALIDVVRTSREKTFWILLFIFFPLISALVYLIRTRHLPRI